MEIREFNEEQLAGLLSDYVKVERQYDEAKLRMDIIKKSFIDSPRDVIKRDNDYTILHKGRCFTFSIKESMRLTTDTKLLDKELSKLGIDIKAFKKDSIVTKFTASESCLFRE